MAGSCARDPGAICTEPRGDRVDKNDPDLQISEAVFWLLIAASDHRGADKEAAATVVAPPPLLQAATSPAQENSRKGKVSALPLSLYFSFFPLFKGDIKDEDIQK